MEKHLKARSFLEVIIQLWTTLLVTKGCQNNKTNPLCWFIKFRKVFDRVPINNLWNILEKLKVPFESRDNVIRLYENIIAKFRDIEGWLEEINCNLGVK